MAEIEFDDVTKRYPDGFEAVKNLNLDVPDGELMILVGPSGCGKSTALRMVAGLEDISGGELKIGGQVVNDKAPKDRDIAMVFQNYALYPHMTVRDNMGFALKLANVDPAEIDRKVSEAARILDLEQHLDRKPANLSGGQRQRVAMGRAIVRAPSTSRTRRSSATSPASPSRPTSTWSSRWARTCSPTSTTAARAPRASTSPSWRPTPAAPTCRRPTRTRPCCAWSRPARSRPEAAGASGWTRARSTSSRPRAATRSRQRSSPAPRPASTRPCHRSSRRASTVTDPRQSASAAGDHA